MNIPYNAKNFPGSTYTDLEKGANCQVFAYSILKYYGIHIPDFRSSELWEDRTFTKQVYEFQVLDLLLFHANLSAFGAHVTVYIGNNEVIHLAKHHGMPKIEHISALSKEKRYAYFIGAKRGIKSFHSKKGSKLQLSTE